MNVAKVLVPLDGSELAESALGAAVEMARPAGGTLILIRAAQSGVRPGIDPVRAQLEVVEEAEHYLATVKGQLGKQGVREVKTAVWYGPAASAIIEAAELNKVDLIVMSSHGRSGAGRLIFGSVAESVLRGTTVPILLLRPAGAPVERPAGSAEARPSGAPR